VFNDGEAELETAVTIPGRLLKVASMLILKSAPATHQGKGIDQALRQIGGQWALVEVEV
jgi:hypothetical protein